MSDTATASARRLETYTRVSLYVMFVLVPVAYLGAFPRWGAAVGLVVGALQAVGNVVVCRRCLTMLHEGRRWPTRTEAIVFAGWSLLTVLVLVAVVGSLDPDGTWVPAIGAAVGAPIAAVAALLSLRAVLLASVGGGALVGLVAAGRAGLTGGEAVGLGMVAAALLVFVGLTVWLSGWMLRNIWELEDARRTAAQLAIAQERLRISRDLHDLFGRTMASVAVKSELAGELVRRGQGDAALVQLGDVRALAEQTGQQVRAVVQGYRPADLTTELLGARSLLDSAGIRCVVRGSAPIDLAPDVVSALVWVLREAVTNVIRHSSATECLISIEPGDPLTMIITNDGVPDRGNDHDREGPGGNGVVGMRERVAPLSGQVTVSRADSVGRFSVAVTLPYGSATRS